MVREPVAENLLSQSCDILSVLSVFKYNPGETNNKFVKLLLNNFYPVMSCRRVQKESDELLCTVWSLVMVRNRLPAQVVKTRDTLYILFQLR